MKSIFKKKTYFFMVLMSFLTLSSSIMYADYLYCENDSQCPPGMICVIPGNFCFASGEIECNQYFEYNTELKCWKETSTYPPCEWDGSQLYTCYAYL